MTSSESVAASIHDLTVSPATAAGIVPTTMSHSHERK
jgi:hypothetical protein